MEKDSHIDYHFITIELTNGKKYKTRSTWGKEGDVLKLEIDPLTHPAWTKSTNAHARGDQVSKFNNKFGKLKI